MKIPSKNTCAYAICALIHKEGPKTNGQLMSALSDRFARNTIVDKINDMESNCQLIRTDNMVGLTLNIGRHFDQCEIDMLAVNKPVVLVPPRQPKPFTPLKNYSLPKDGMREGAGDHRKFKSRHLP